ncbi:hypothetical protein LINPERPRIM_LOCUS6668 [Linum perenne]
MVKTSSRFTMLTRHSRIRSPGRCMTCRWVSGCPLVVVRVGFFVPEDGKLISAFEF